MRTPLILGLLGALFLPLSLAGQETKPVNQQDWEITSEEAARENPVEPEEETLQEGKVLFDSQCAMCHGKTGDGKGDLAASLGAKIADLTNPATLRGITDGALFAMLTKGKGKMPGLENRLPDLFQWKLVNYIRTLSAPASSSAGNGGASNTAAKQPQTSSSPPE